ncbi:MAG: AI-2E family transporter [Bacillota bacterium]
MFFKGKKIPYIELLPVIFIVFILFKIVNNTSILIDSIKFILSLLSYLIWAFGIAYFLNPVMVFLEKRFKIRRAFSIMIIYVCLVAVLFVSITVITPILVDNVKQLWDNMPRYVETTEKWVNRAVSDLKSQDRYNIEPYIVESINDFLGKANKFIDLPINFLLKKAVDLTSTLLKFIFGLIIAIYFLNDKEKIIRNIKKLLYAFLNKSAAYSLISIGKKVHLVFSRYILGKTIDSLIIGLICFLVLSIFRMPFALLISLIVGVTNMIPYVGPFIGAVPAVLITLFASPEKALWVAVFILILQQFDGWYLGPKIIGDQVGISPLLIITAIIVGGGTFGIIGMFLGVPLFAVVKLFLDEYVERRLKSRDVDFK